MLAGKPPTAMPSKKGSNADQALSRPANYTREPAIGSSVSKRLPLIKLFEPP